MYDAQKDAVDELKRISSKFKPNPFHYPIVNKWNIKYVWNPYRIKIFNLVTSVVEDKIIEALNDEYFDRFKQDID